MDVQFLRDLVARADPKGGTADAPDNSVQTVVTSLVWNGVIAIIFILIFLILRPRFPRVYSKKNVAATVPEADRPRPLPKGFLKWLPDLLTRKDPETIKDVGLDGYFFLRFLRFMFYLSVLGGVILMPILLPVNATNGLHLSGFQILSFGNIKNHQRYYAHAFCSWLFFGLVLFFIYREMFAYAAIRQAVLTSESQRTLLSNRTVLINSIPLEYVDEAYLRKVFPNAKYIFLGFDAAKLQKAVKTRTKLMNNLEGAESKYIMKGVKNRLKLEKKGKAESNNIADYVKKLPTMRLQPLIGKKVETFTYAKQEIPYLNREIWDMQSHYTENKKLNSAFIVFHTQSEAEFAAQTLTFQRPLEFAPRTVGVHPDEVVWENLGVTWWQRLIKSFAASAFCIALIIFWAIPVAFVGFISQIKNLIALFHWLNFLNKLPNVLFGLISSLLPTIMLGLLMMVLPMIIRKAAKIQGAATNTQVEYYTQNVFFAFQVVHAFFVVMLSSSILSALKQILNDPSTILHLLQERLPNSSPFFLNWILFNALTIASGGLLQIVALVLYILLGKLLDNTPRKKWSRENLVGPQGYGTVFPPFTNMAVIMFSYSILTPIMLVFTAFLFITVYIGMMHNLTFIIGPSNGRGIYYKRALSQLFVGLYVAQLCLIAMFVFSKSWGPVVLEVVIALVTIWVQVHLRKAFGPLTTSLPRSLVEGNPNGASVSPVGEFGKEYKDNDSNATAAQGGDPYAKQHGANNTTAQTAAGANGQLSDKQVDYIHQTNPYFAGRTGQSDTAAFVDSEQGNANGRNGAAPEKMGFFTRVFKPHKYYTVENVRATLLTHPSWHTAPPALSQKDESGAYRDPAVNAGNPVVWFPSDPYGWGDQQMSELRHAEINAWTSGAWVQVDQEKKKARLEYTNNINEIPVHDTGKPGI